ncbi:mechanosensitive ion channel family protein [Streptococcus massiliensis]|uniref:Mechanosensitive ion channel protein n=1 Tax=Streptococcus massiliensis TaxID=313439 RepID=A0A380L4A2_9STRE|nr:mechanosensitive ion channel family protein [Streptococcus massiliensis]SUN77331.1 mechanosensitive ion channel protein [Streptococcus massiliensis]
MPKFLIRFWEKIDWTALADDAFLKIISLLLLCILFYIAKKILHLTVNKIIAPSLKLSNQGAARQRTISRLIENLLNYALYFFLIYWVLSILGLPVSSLLAGAGIAGVAIGMGAQGFLSDLVNGFFILLERQLDVGDNVSLTNGSITIKGIVVSVGIRTTQVRGHDGTLHFVPNRNITVVSNLSRGDMQVIIDLPLQADTDLGKVTKILEAVNQAELRNYPAILGAIDLLGPQVDTRGVFSYRIRMKVQNGSQSAVYHEFYSLYHKALLEAGISLPTLISSSK